METLDRLTESLDFTDYASRIIHPIVRTLDTTPELRSTSMDTLSSLVFQLGKKVARAVPRAPFLDVATINCTVPVSLLLASHKLNPPVLSLPARLLMSLTITRQGWCLRERMRSHLPQPVLSSLPLPYASNPCAVNVWGKVLI